MYGLMGMIDCFFPLPHRWTKCFGFTILLAVISIMVVAFMRHRVGREKAKESY
jgi:hypothetical protein